MVYDKTQLHVWVLPNQIDDMNKVKKVLGKTKTDIVIEALGYYLNMLRKQGVL